jgi:cation:H+ antiporter
MLTGIIAMAVGGLLLYWSAQRFVVASVNIAIFFKWSPLFVGIIIMGFATSAPELLTSIIAAIEHVPGIAIGNAYGSNIANIGLCIGLTALFKPIKVSRNIIKQEFPFLVLITFATVLLLFNFKLTRIDGTLLLFIFIIFFCTKIFFMRKESTKQGGNPPTKISQPLSTTLLWLVTSFALLLVSAQALVWGAENVALALHINELTIGLTVVAIGTSLPECAATMSAIKQQQSELALGNIIGSNIFNTLAAVGLTSVITPVVLPSAILYRDIMVMCLLTLLFVVFCYKAKGGAVIGRTKGAALLIVYVSYIIYMLITL